MVSKRYKDYINSDRWKAKVAAYWQRNGKYCKACGATKNLHVHHMTYERFGGGEYMSDLMGLCHKCHRDVHTLDRKTGRRNLRAATFAIIEREQQKRRARSEKLKGRK